MQIKLERMGYPITLPVNALSHQPKYVSTDKSSNPGCEDIVVLDFKTLWQSVLSLKSKRIWDFHIPEHSAASQTFLQVLEQNILPAPAADSKYN